MSVYNLPVGIPPALLPCVFNELIKLSPAVRLYKWGIVLCWGAAEVYIKHDIHGSKQLSGATVRQDLHFQDIAIDY